jgi:hypothetical protein
MALIFCYAIFGIPLLIQPIGSISRICIPSQSHTSNYNLTLPCGLHIYVKKIVCFQIVVYVFFSIQSIEFLFVYL